MIKMSVENVDAEFKRLKAEYLNEIDKQFGLKIQALLEDLRTATPIDTGHARASWKIEEFQRRLKDLNCSAEIVNTADYIAKLNRGSSKQAPAYFIETTALKHGKPLGIIVREVD